MMGKDIKSLQELIDKLEILVEEEKKEKDTNDITNEIVDSNTIANVVE